MDDTFAYEGVIGEIWLIEEEWGSWLVAEPEIHGPGCRGLSRQHPCCAQQPGQRSQGLLAVRRLIVPGRDLYCCTQLLLSYLYLQLKWSRQRLQAINGQCIKRCSTAKEVLP